MKTRDEMIAWTMNYCQHYEMRGMPKTCKAGVEYDAVGKFSAVIEGKEKDAAARPCINGHLMPDALARCPKWIRKTREMGEKRYDDLQASMARMRVVGPVVAEWRKKPPRGKAEVIECPACKGRLHLAQAASNGHVHGQCETAGCVSWME